MNVETIRQRRSSSERYSFREHAAGKWSLEHIHAQSAESLTTAREWGEWLRLHRALSRTSTTSTDETKPVVLDRVNAVLARTNDHQGRLRPARVRTGPTAPREQRRGETIDSISNLALLAGADNSALNNSVFAAKRAEISSATARLLHPRLHAECVLEVLHTGRRTAAPLLELRRPVPLPR